MCTALSYKTKHHYFGRNLDLERGYGEKVIITPRNFVFDFRFENQLSGHYALIGMGVDAQNFPLYFEATNEKGLSMAGLNFPKNASYAPCLEKKSNVAPFELIPKILGECETTDSAADLISKINIVHINFSDSLPLSPLHWMISDKEKSIVLECTKDGTKIYDNPFEVLTNNPTFDFHSMNMNNFMGLSNGAAKQSFDSSVPFENYSLGIGALGLPGDFSSASRFVRAFFVKENSVDEGEPVNQFFHIMQSVAMPKGCVKTDSGFEYTRYTSCCDADSGVYYYTTYSNSQISAVNMHHESLNGNTLIAYPLNKESTIHMHN